MELDQLIQAEIAEEKLLWEEAKNKLNGLIHPKYFDFAEDHDSYCHKDIVNIVEVAERQQGYANFSHCREAAAKKSPLYMKHIVDLCTIDEKSKYEGQKIEYWVWQTSGYICDNYSGYLLLPLFDGRFWKIHYSC